MKGLLKKFTIRLYIRRFIAYGIEATHHVTAHRHTICAFIIHSYKFRKMILQIRALAVFIFHLTKSFAFACRFVQKKLRHYDGALP